MILIAVGTGVGLISVWLWCGRRDPLIQLAPFALALPPLFAYGGKAFGWPVAWVSTRVALVASILLFLFFRLARGDFSYRRIPGMSFVAPYLLLVVGSVLWSFGAYYGEAATIGNEVVTWVIPIAIFFLIAASADGESDVMLASRVLVGVATVVTIYSGLQALVLTGNERLVPGPIAELTRYGQSDLWFGSFRLYGTLPNLGPNFLGAFLLTPTVLAVSRAFATRRLARIVWLLGAVAGVAVVIGTYSRGALLGLAVALVALPFWWRSARGVVLTLCALAIVGLGMAETPIGQYATSVYSAGQLDVSGSARLDMWRGVLESGADHPFGLGFNGWLRASRTSTHVGLLDPPASIGSERPAENQWMREFADRGVLGVLALMWLMGGTIWLTFRAAERAPEHGYPKAFLAAAGASFAGWTIVFLTGDHLMYDNVAGIFWYTVAVALVAVRHAVELGTVRRAPLPNEISQTARDL